MRLFVALDVPDRICDAVATAVAPHRGDDRVTWTRPSGWHVTLAFVGEVTADDLGDDPVEVVRAAAADGCRAAGVGAPVDLRTGGLVRLGRGALAVELADDPAGAVAALGGAIQAALQEAGLPVTPRAVRPHLTLARARRRSVPAGLVEAIEVPVVTWAIDAVHVVQSHLGKGPATYEQRASVPLAAP